MRLRPLTFIVTLILAMPLPLSAISALANAQSATAAPVARELAREKPLSLQKPKEEASLSRSQVESVSQHDWRTTLQLIAILAAVGIFGGREILEASRRRSSRENKLNALKAIIARECELNNYTTGVLLRNMKEMKENFDLEDDDPYKYEYRISFRRDGSAILEHTRGGQWWGSGPIPKVHSGVISARLMDVAELDFALYNLTEAALSGLAELEHVRASLISCVLKEDDHIPDMIQGLPDYAIGEIENSASALKNLYLACAGRPLTDRRLR